MASLFGWELLFKSVEGDIRNNQDVLVCFSHLVLISNGFKCVGLGDSKNLDGTETKSELLPQGWNENYAIRYVYQGHLYNFQATNMDDSIMVNLIRVQERTVSMVQLNIQSVAQRTGSLDQMIPNHDELAANIKNQLINKVCVSTKYKDSTSQTTNENPRSENPGMPFSPVSPSPSFTDRVLEPSPFGPFYNPIRNVGRSDLHPNLGPFAPSPGGMLFDPRPGSARVPPNTGIPPGSLPPGARFDPFRPPPEDERRGRWPRRPDNDDFPPPGFDDMFM